MTESNIFQRSSNSYQREMIGSQVIVFSSSYSLVLSQFSIMNNILYLEENKDYFLKVTCPKIKASESVYNATTSLEEMDMAYIK